ncbi:helix-turn-helix transcriptional regulator [Microbacterium esteraromaticum]|uniref:helix-turn-helix transcriptional regulator n=1 Tax=Microbacterium esteraromaticum TaxID=57043 RepID=UPI0019D3358D|nr:helix-turn-helix domain-containing protein [Microbacterium esteraromaticum]MBN7792517.1 helix-turn-helix domain-containing protein [Microbacterium esteraromaticum]
MSTSTPSRSLTGWATMNQAAAALGVSRDTIRRMIERGEVYAERIGPRLVRVDLSSIRPVPLGPVTTPGPAPAPGRTLRRPLEVTERIAAGGDE